MKKLFLVLFLTVVSNPLLAQQGTTKKKAAATKTTTVATSTTEADFNANPGKSKGHLVARGAPTIGAHSKTNFRSVASVPAPGGSSEKKGNNKSSDTSH